MKTILGDPATAFSFSDVSLQLKRRTVIKTQHIDPARTLMSFYIYLVSVQMKSQGVNLQQKEHIEY
jgi:hypothetical protein